MRSIKSTWFIAVLFLIGIFTAGIYDARPGSVRRNTAPAAHAGLGQTVAVGEVVRLDGTCSSDVDGDLLSFHWSLISHPAGSNATLSNPKTIAPSFRVDREGRYKIRLIVSDGWLNSAADTVTISTENSRPVAHAGFDRTVAVGDDVSLNGSGSSDVDGNLLSFHWTLVSFPAGSSATLSNPNAITPTFRVDREGNYEVQLTVNDGVWDSAADTVTISTKNSRPVAHAGPDRTAKGVGVRVPLDGSGSGDVDGDDLSYRWSIVYRPETSQATLVRGSCPDASPQISCVFFDVDVPGLYVVQLIVDDGITSSVPDTMTISAKNSRPLADAGQDRTVLAGYSVQLDGGGSQDADKDELAFSWSFSYRPDGSSAEFTDPTAADPAFTTDLEGDYVAQLMVDDGVLKSVPDTVRTIAGAPGDCALQFIDSPDGIVTVGRMILIRTILSVPALPPGGTLALASDPSGIVELPATVSIDAGDTSVEFEAEGIAPGITTVRASAQGYGQCASQMRVVRGAIGLPDSQNACLARQTSIQVGISPDPAPAGGVDVELVSEDASVVEVVTPVVHIPEGHRSASGSLRGGAFGNTTVSARHPDYVAGDCPVETTGNLNLVENAISFNACESAETSIELLSCMEPIAAPAPGVEVVLEPSDPQCVSAPSPVMISTGAGSTPAMINYGSTASLPCSTWLSASAVSPFITGESVRVFVEDGWAITMKDLPARVGSGLQDGPFEAVLATSNHGGVTATISSSDLSAVSVSEDASQAGSGSVRIWVPNGQRRAFYYINGAAETIGAATMTASAPRFCDGSGTVDTVRPELRIKGLETSILRNSPDDPFQVQSGIQTEAEEFDPQPAQAGSQGYRITVENTDTGVAQLKTPDFPDGAQSVTVTIAEGQDASPGSVADGGVAFDPLTGGTTAVLAEGAGFIGAQETVTVTLPGITMPDPPPKVGAGLQAGPYWAELGNTDHGGVLVTVTSGDPSIALVSPDQNARGSASIQVRVASGEKTVPYYIQGMENQTDDVTITASAEGFDQGSGTARVVQPQLALKFLLDDITYYDPDDDFNVYTGIKNGDHFHEQSTRIGGGDLEVTVSNSNPTIARLKTAQDPFGAQSVTLAIPEGRYHFPSGTIALDPLALATGTTTVAAAVAGFTGAEQDVEVTAPKILMEDFPQLMGSGLQWGDYTALLESPGHPGVHVTISSENSEVVRVSPDADTTGRASIQVWVASGDQRARYYIQGMENHTGTVNITASAPAFITGENKVEVVTPQLKIVGLADTHPVSGADDPFKIRLGIPIEPFPTFRRQAARLGGGAIPIAVESSHPGVGQLVTSEGAAPSATVMVAEGQTDSPATVNEGGIAFDPIAVGETNITAENANFSSDSLKVAVIE